MTTLNASGQDERGAAIAGLRELADFLAANPAVPAGRSGGWTLLMFPEAGGDAAGLAAVDRVAAVLGVPVCDDTARGGHYRACRSFGPVAYEFVHVLDAYRAASAARQSYEPNITAALVSGDVAA